MATQTEPEITLYDLACTKNECFSPVVWKIRLMLNYKKVPYKTIFLEFPDIEPTLKGLGLPPGDGNKYTVPAIQHIPTKKHLMDSATISEFIESTYPDPSVPLKSELGIEVESKARRNGGMALQMSNMAREINILSPRSKEFFRRTREAKLGHPLEELLVRDKEEQAWNAAAEGLRNVGELIRTNKAEGPFILGAIPSYADFFVAGAMQCSRVIDESVFQRMFKYPGFADVYEACLPYMEKRD